MAAMDVARSLSSTPAVSESFRAKAATPEPHYRLSRLNTPSSASLRPPSAISRSVSAGMTFSFKKEKEKDKDHHKDNKHHPRAPSPDGRPSSSRFAFTLRKKVSLASLMSSASTSHDEGAVPMTRTLSMPGAGHATLAVPLIEEVPVPGPSLVVREEDEDDTDSDEDVHAPDRFVKKNAWRTRNKMKLHPYPEVPYMQAYDPVVLESERATHFLLQRLRPVASPTFHDYKNTPPASVLDLGCGSGLWLLDAARTWRSTQFVGLDLVDVAVSPLTDGSTHNVRLVRGDFLKYALPFPDRQFELVRMANLALCIPLPKWEYVLREVARVLAPGGRLELVDDQTLFAYGDAPIEEAAEVLSPHPATTPTAHPMSPSTPTPMPRAPPPTPESSGFTGGRAPPTPESSGFFDSSDDEEDTSDESVQLEPSDDEFLLPPTPDSASERSSFNDAASTLVGDASERGSVELKKLSLSSSGAPQLDFEPIHRPFSGVDHLVISIPPQEPLAVIDVTVEDEESEDEEGEPPTPVGQASLSASAPRPTSTTPTPTSVSPPTSDSAPPTPSPLPSPSLPEPTPPPTPAPVEETSSGPWSTQRAAARDMERVFLRMLITRYGLHTRVADVLVPMLARVFCAGRTSGRVEQPTNMYLKLAPVGVEEREGVVRQERTSSESERERESLDGKSVRSWMTTVEWEKEKEGSVRKGKSSKKEKEQRVSEPPVPLNLSAKAAERLGITTGAVVPQFRRQPTLVESPEGSEEEEEEESDLSDLESPVSPTGSEGPTGVKGRGPSTWVAPDEWAAPPPVVSRESSSSSSTGNDSIPAAGSSKTITAAASSNTITAAGSTKTLKQLGLPPVSPAVAQFTPPPPLTHTRGGSNASAMSTSSSASSGAWSESDDEGRAPRFTSGHVQHPGLILWPATFIPVPPQELEMHATKHVQTLLGCKPALAEFVSTFVDPETGRRLVSEGEFEDAVWDYECFRRPRFNWPELPETRLEGDDLYADLPTPASARSMQHSIPRTPTAVEPPVAKSTETHPFEQHELTHVRTFRVFGAVKGGVPAAPLGML